MTQSFFSPVSRAANSLSPDVTSHALRRGNVNDPKNIHKAASDFEAVLLSMLFKKMQESVSASSFDDQGSGGETLRDIGVQELASAATKSGGIGIARIISSYLERESNLPGR